MIQNTILKETKFDIPFAKPYITDEMDYIREVVESGWWTTGYKTAEFESLLVEYLKDNEPLYCTAVNSCTSALFLSLKSLNIKEGDEVIVPTWTFTSTAQIVEWLGAKLVLSDIEKNTLNIDVHRLENLITSKTKAILPVHFAGYPCEINEISSIAEKYNLKVIEDSAHAVGTKYHHLRIGNYSETTCFSFYATKNLAMGEGGAVVSRNKDIIDQIKKIAYLGINRNAYRRYDKEDSWYYDVQQLGYKCNLSDLHAVIGIAQLKKLDWMNDKRRHIVKIYKDKLHKDIQFLKDSEEHYHSHHLFPILVPEYIQRNDLINYLKSKSISTSVHFIPVHQHSYYKTQFNHKDFPVANQRFEQVISLPNYPSLTDDELDYVIKNINHFIRSK